MQKVTDFIYVLWNPKEKIDPVTDFGQQIADQASTLWDAKKEIEYNLNGPVERMLTSSASIAQACLNDRIREQLLPTYQAYYPKNVYGQVVYDFLNSTDPMQFWVPQYHLYRQDGIITDAAGKIGEYYETLGPLLQGLRIGGKDKYTVDPIHVGPQGYKAWGMITGTRLAEIGWNVPAVTSEIPLEVSLEKADAWLKIRKRAIKEGLIGQESSPKGETVIGKTGSNYIYNKGYYRKYKNSSAIFVHTKRNSGLAGGSGDAFSDAFYLPNAAILKEYFRLGGPEKSRFGMPTSDELCWGPSGLCNFVITFFENGYMLYDKTLITGGYFTDVCDLSYAGLSDTVRNSDPDFNTCVSSRCVTRWFAFNNLPLTADSGTPPFKWELTEGSLPPGMADPNDMDFWKNGILKSGPINDPNREWKAKIRLTDARGKSVTKEIIFYSGL